MESYELTNYLTSTGRVSLSKYDTAPLDSNKLGVFYSPQTMIDEDIIAQLGYINLDQYIGDPEYFMEKSYPDLKSLANDYWKKYSSKNDINAYIQMFSLFDLSFFKQLDQLIPARVDKIKGLLIQPNLLERSKDTIWKPMEIRHRTYSSSIDISKEVESSTVILSTINKNISIDASANVDIITGSVEVPGVTESTSTPLSTNINSNTLIMTARGQKNHRYLGCKLTGPDINIPTDNWPDGAPVITKTTVSYTNLTTNTGNQSGGVFSGEKDTEITLTKQPEIIVSKNDPSTETVKNNPSSGGNTYNAPENKQSSPPPTITINKSKNQSKSGDSGY